MAEASQILPSSGLRQELMRRGADNVARCYQCATCSSVCALSTPENSFPRRQVHLAQWGMVDHLAADPAPWLCHQCADCSERCPRDVKPGDVLQAVRSAVVEKLAFPGWIGKIVGKASVTWPLLLLAPWAFWLLLLGVTGHLTIPEGTIVYEKFVPHWLIYAVFFPVAGYVTLVAGISGARFWKMIGQGQPRRGSFLSGLISVCIDVATHKSFGECEAKPSRKTGHLLLFWGFAGAAITSALLIVAIYIQHMELPIPLLHPYKILGNLSALALVVGGVMLIVNRWGSGAKLTSTRAFDAFFLIVVALVIATGVIIEAGRYFFPAAVAYGLYTVHLGVVMTLFLTFPYSKFAHMLYRTLALVHQRMTAREEGQA
jgi:quinone-modifying oxidoreductase subunit QmoC